MSLKTATSALLLVAIAIAPLAADVSETAPVVSVIPFDATRTEWLPPPGLGTTAADLLAARLVDSGRYRVLDAGYLAIGSDDAARQPLGRITRLAAAAHVDYVIVGVIDRLSHEQKKKHFGGILLPILFATHGIPFAGGLGKTETDTVLSVTVRVIDVNDGEIVRAATGNGLASRTDRSIGGLGSALAGGYGQSSLNSKTVMIDDALRAAIQHAADSLVVTIPPSHTAPVAELQVP
jgi:curli biogenesis system outer membrane secretion channel CsgG